jgi:hypothetical protein
MSRPDWPNWLGELETLVTRFAHIGVSEDIAALSVLEAWQLLTYLRRLAETQATG